jgi:hypothetical protein
MPKLSSTPKTIKALVATGGDWTIAFTDTEVAWNNHGEDVVEVMEAVGITVKALYVDFDDAIGGQSAPFLRGQTVAQLNAIWNTQHSLANIPA